jgi:hypothetical protein
MPHDDLIMVIMMIMDYHHIYNDDDDIGIISNDIYVQSIK